jgi:hypothetical protein
VFVGQSVKQQTGLQITHSVTQHAHCTECFLLSKFCTVLQRIPERDFIYDPLKSAPFPALIFTKLRVADNRRFADLPCVCRISLKWDINAGKFG